MALSENMKTIRKERGLTLKQLSDSLGIPVAQLSQYEAGEKVPNGIRLVAIADALKVSAEQLVNGKNKKEN